MTKTLKDSKLKLLWEDGRKLYHTQDLAVLWGIQNPNTLYPTIGRYVQRGFLKSIYKGFYSTVPIKQIDPVLLGLVALRNYGYLSMETVLAENGIIFQDIKYITLISSFSKRIKIENHNFLVRKMKEDFLYNETDIIFSENGARASAERAIADMLYFNPNYYFDTKDINWQKVKEIQQKIGY